MARRQFARGFDAICDNSDRIKCLFDYVRGYILGGAGGVVCLHYGFAFSVTGLNAIVS